MAFCARFGISLYRGLQAADGSSASYIPERLRSRVNALNSVLLTTGASVFSLLMGFLGKVLDYRWCVTFGGAATLLACHFLIGGRRQDVRKVYEAG